MMRRYLNGLGAWSGADYDRLDARISAAADRLDAFYEGIAQAEARGVPESRIDAAFAQYDAFWVEIDALYEGLNTGRDSGTPDTLSMFDAQVEGLERRIADWQPLGANVEVARTSMIVYATLGSLAVAGALAGLLWFLSRRR
jgi:hypothetical protein